MRREGRPHGMVRTYNILPAPLNPRPPSRTINKLVAPPTAGIFTNVSHKPNNHSKFTGKCGKARCTGCHLYPACKSKDKSKGTQKLRTSNATVNYQQVTWRVVGLNKMRGFGYSASGILDQLRDHNYHEYDDDDDEDDDEENGHEYVDDVVQGKDDGVEQGKSDEIIVEASNNGHGQSDINDNDNDDNDANDNDDDIIIHVGVTDDDDDGYKGFYDVAYVLTSVDEDEEGWSVIG